MLRIILLTEKKQTLDIFFTIIRNFIYDEIKNLGTFHIVQFPIKCIKHGAVEHSTFH